MQDPENSPNQVLCFGFSGHGQCGGDIEEKTQVPRQLCIKRARQIACGHLHTLVLSDCGQVWSFGNNENGQLGFPSPAGAKPTPPKLVIFFHDKEIVSVSANGFLSAALSSHGDVYSFGRYHYQRKPTRVKGLQNISGTVVEISCGTDHLLMRSSEGEVYSCGRNGSRQLGYPSLRSQEENFDITAARVEGDLRGARVVQVSCGDRYSAALSEDGEVYTWGDSTAGKTGHLDWGQHELNTIMSMLSSVGPRCRGPQPHHNTQEYEKVPRRVATLSHLGIKQISCGSHHLVAVSRDGVAYSCGSGVNGRLGHGREETLRTPTAIESLRRLGRVKRIFVGDSHNIAILESGEIFSWGYSCYGQLGIDMQGLEKSSHVSTPQPVTVLDGLNVTNIACGGGHTVVVGRPIPVTLKQLCERSIEKEMAADDACQVAQYAEYHSATSLWKRACLTIAMHYDRIRRTRDFRDLSEETLAEINRLLGAARPRSFSI